MTVRLYLVDGHSQRVYVRCYPQRRSFEEFRRHPILAAHLHIHAFRPSRIYSAAVDIGLDARQSKVAKYAFATVIDQDIGPFDITVNNSLGVQIGQS